MSIQSLRVRSRYRQRTESGHASLSHHFRRSLQSEFGALFRWYVLETPSEHLRADPVHIADFLQGPEESSPVKDALSRHQTLIVTDLLRRQFWSIGDLHMNN